MNLSPYRKTAIAAAAVIVEALQMWAASGDVNWVTVIIAILGVFGVWATPNKTVAPRTAPPDSL